MPLRVALAVLVAACALTLSRPAAANPFGYHEHDGFYMRFGGGVTTLNLHRDTDRSGSAGTIAYEGDTSDVKGTAIAAEVSVGGTPLRKLVIAGTAIFMSLPAAELRLGTGARFNLDSSLNFVLLAPTVDLFLDPARGFHFGGGMGLAYFNLNLEDAQFKSIGGTGVGVTLHVGYDLWAGDDWSIGAAVRGVLARVNGEQNNATVSGSERDSFASAALVITALYH